MTLLTYHCNSDDFVMVTSDTREKTVEMDEETGLYTEKIKYTRDDAVGKTGVLTNYSLFATGGISALSRLWKEYMFLNTEKHYFLDDLIPVMEDSKKYINDIIVSNEKLTKNKDREELKSTLFYVVGFHKDGSTGIVVATCGDEHVVTSKVPKEYRLANVITPTNDLGDENRQKLANFELTQDVTGNETSTILADKVLHHFFFVHSIVAAKYEESVSDTCIHHALIKEDGKLEYITGSDVLTEQVKQVKNKS